VSTIYEIRRENLKALIRQHGNQEVAVRAGYPNGSFLSQMTGPQAIRQVSEKTARRVEEALALPVGWMDTHRDEYGKTVEAAAPEGNSPPPVSEPIPLLMVDHERFAVCAAAVSNAMVNLGAKLSTKKFTTIVTMLMERTDLSEPALFALAETLVKIAV